MPLADDLMEPFRPVVDVRVRALVQRGIRDVGKDSKHELAAVLMDEQPTLLGMSPLATCLMRLAHSLTESYLSGVPALDLPLLRLPSAPDTGEEAAPDAPE
jgi:CRISPR-associated protein Cas1